MTSKPLDLSYAQLIDGLAQRYGQLPSSIINEPASILKMLAIVEEGNNKAKDSP